jgi:hypothetical protein
MTTYQTTDILKDYYSEEEVCIFLGLNKRSLQTKRSMGKNHPPFRKFGKTIRYPKKEFHRWSDSQELRVAI